MEKLDYAYLLSWVEKIFHAMGCSEKDAGTAAAVLLEADLRGIDSHGVARLEGYVRLWKAGRAVMQPELKIIRERAATATVDAGKALGLVSGQFAMNLAIKKALNAGTGWVAVGNSNHFGIAAAHAMLALPHNMIGIAMTNASALVAPTFSDEPMLGTNPICVAVPALTQPPFVGDMATSVVANGKLEIKQRLGDPIPEGWAQDENGVPTHNAAILKEHGTLLPLGSDAVHSSYKGYVLGAIVDIFTGVLSGASFGPWAPPFPAYLPMPEDMPGKGLGHFFGAISIDAFEDVPVFLEKMDKWIARFREAHSASSTQKVLIPGDPERRSKEERLRNGIPLLPQVVDSLKKIGHEFAIAFQM